MIKFGHLADAHLGFRQYGLDERRSDFEKAFVWAVNQFIKEDVCFVLIAGDLFHNKNPDFSDMTVAKTQLNRLSEKGIKVYAIYGNHDMPSRTDKSNWVSHFNMIDHFGYNQSLIRNFGIDFCIHLINWTGNNTENEINKLDFDSRRYNILMLHGGPDNPENHVSGQFKLETLKSLKNKVSYIALGHIHKPYIIDGFIVNPGSLETNSMNEWSYKNRGISVVTVNDDKSHSIKIIPVPNNRKTYQKDVIWSLMSDELLEQIKDIPNDALVHLNLVGNVEFPIKPITITLFENKIKELYNPLWLSISNKTKIKSQIKNIEKRPDNIFHSLLNEEEFAILCTKIKDSRADNSEIERLVNEYVDNKIKT